MGCDIHAAIEYKNGDGKWHCVTGRPNKWFSEKEPESEENNRTRYDLDLNRDYDMFAILGNVRNGSGFAGIKTGEGFLPISDCRGVPADSAPETLQALSNEHSATWVSLRELLEYDWTRGAVHYGVVDAVTFEKWDRVKEWNPQPDTWCGDVSGNGITHTDENTMRAKINDIKKRHHGNWTAIDKAIQTELNGWHCRIKWETDCADDGAQIWRKILPVMLPLGKDHGYDNVRLVMDFDS